MRSIRHRKAGNHAMLPGLLFKHGNIILPGNIRHPRGRLMLEFLFQLIFEVVLQIALEILAEFGMHVVRDRLRQPANPWLAGMGYLVFGIIIGGLSLLVLHEHFIRSGAGRFLNLIITPVLAGLAMSWLGAWRQRRGQVKMRLDRFAYGYLFALGFAAIRLAAGG